jgi:hypothetical protein
METFRQIAQTAVAYVGNFAFIFLKASCGSSVLTLKNPPKDYLVS